MQLSGDLLAELEASLRGASVGWLDRAHPGLSDAQMDELTAPLGLTLPAEARVWWGWHNGCPRVQGEAMPEIGPGKQFISLEIAVEQCELEREGADEAAEDDPTLEWWRQEWFPVVGPPPIVCDCSVAIGDPTPMRCVDVHADPEGTYLLGDPPVSSFGELVSIWIRTIGDGGWHFSQDGSSWRRDESRCDRSLRLAGLI